MRRRNYQKIRLFLLSLMIILLSSGCAANLARSLSASNINFKNIKPNKSSPQSQAATYNAAMQWEYQDVSTSSLCQPQIQAAVNLKFTVDAKNKITGQGTITYKNITTNSTTAMAAANASGTATPSITNASDAVATNITTNSAVATSLCAQCGITGQDAILTLSGSLEDGQNALIKPVLKSGGAEQQVTTSCREGMDATKQETKHLLFSLEQAGFFDKWSIVLQKKTTKNFSWEVAGRSGHGLLQIK